MDVWGHLSLWYLLIFCGQSLEVFDLYEIQVILFLYWKVFFELLIFPWFDAVTCMFLALVHGERTINTVQEYIYFFILSSIILIVLYMYDFCYFAFLFCFLIKSLKKKSKSMLNNRKFMGIMFEFKVRNLVILVLSTLSEKGRLIHVLFICLIKPKEQKTKSANICSADWKWSF